MNRTVVFYVLAALLIASWSCKNKGEKGSGTDLVTVKTLGLAYLEEFRHDDAEKEFMKFIKLAPGDKFGYANLGLTYLRTGRYDEAKKQLEKAIEIDPADPDIRLIMATVYQMTDKNDLALNELKTALGYSPAHIKTLYQISEISATGTDGVSKKEREDALRKLCENAPANLVPRLNLTDILIRTGRSDEALAQLESVRQIFPEFPKESTGFYNETVALLRKKDTEKALIQFTIFHNYLKVSAPYQAGMLDLKGPGGSLIGFPVITFDRPNPALGDDNSFVNASVKFTDATVNAGLEINGIAASPSPDSPAAVTAAADFDSDGDIDIFCGTFTSDGSYRQLLMVNESNRFTDAASASGIIQGPSCTSASFTDTDNDGFLDLLTTGTSGTSLYRNADKGSLKKTEGYPPSPSGILIKGTLSLDADHDGDLDVFEYGAKGSRLMRNNGDATFTDITEKSGIDGKEANDAAFGDFDEDGDLDFAVGGTDGLKIWSNQRQGYFKNIAAASGIKTAAEITAIAVADINNDGFADIALAEKGKALALYTNLKNSTFALSKNDRAEQEATAGLTVAGMRFTDYNNDGFTDLAVAGKNNEPGKRGLVLLKNDGKGGFTDDSAILPPDVNDAAGITVFDYNDDGDPDFIIAGVNGGIRLLRNDGGNNNHFIKMKLVGLRAGSAKTTTTE
jgi:Flp pilus assembly protein TadD